MNPEKVIVIPDTHGHLTEVENLVGRLDNWGYLKDRRLVFLGDYLDRGPAIKQLVSLAIDLAAEGHVMLAGNHEYTLCQALDEQTDEQETPRRDWWANRWLQKYQSQTLASYGIDYSGGYRPSYWADKLRQQMPPSHFDFLASLPWVFENDQLVAVHSGFDPLKPLGDQIDDLLAKKTQNPRGPQQLFSRQLGRETDHLGKLVVSGHCRQTDPYVSPHRVLLDCGVDSGGRLVAYVADSNEIID